MEKWNDFLNEKILNVENYRNRKILKNENYREKNKSTEIAYYEIKVFEK